MFIDGRDELDRRAAAEEDETDEDDMTEVREDGERDEEGDRGDEEWGEAEAEGMGIVMLLPGLDDGERECGW